MSVIVLILLICNGMFVLVNLLLFIGLRKSHQKLACILNLVETKEGSIISFVLPNDMRI